MDPKFIRVVEQLHPRFEALLQMQPCRDGKLPKGMPQQGIYLFSEGARHLYVGRSNSLRRRYGQHCNPASQHNQAVFAFKLAREGTGQVKPGYVPGATSRVGLSKTEPFMASFVAAKTRIRRMDYRFVEEADQTLQAILELYCAIALGCPYNDFNTH